MSGPPGGGGQAVDPINALQTLARQGEQWNFILTVSVEEKGISQYFLKDLSLNKYI